MKSKFYKLMGVALTVVLLASLTVGLAGVPAGAASSNLKFVKFDLPQVGADGDYFLTPGTNVGPIATSPDGELFAAVTDFAALGEVASTTATWSTTQAHSGSCSALLTKTAGGADGSTYVEFVPVGMFTAAGLDDIAGGWSFWHYTPSASANWAQLELKFEDPNSVGFVEVTLMALQNYTGTDAWVELIVTAASERVIFYGEDENGTGVAWDGASVYALEDIEAAIDATSVGACGDWELTRVRVELWEDAPARACYIDDVTINGATYDMAGFYLFKSTDGGYTWKLLEGFDNVVDIVTSPEYADDERVFVATGDIVYQSVDGGETFVNMPATAWAGETITDLDVAMDDYGITVIVSTATGGFAGDVYVYGAKTLTWTEQGILSSILGAVDVLACAFSPKYADDELIMAVITNDTPDNGASGGPDGTTAVRFAITPTIDANPAAWGVTYGDARIRDADDHGFLSTSARMAFPDDFDAGGIGNNVVFAGIYAGGTGDGYVAGERGDVYKVTVAEGPLSPAKDLDIRGEVSTLLPTATNVASIDVAGNAEDCSIMAGTDFIDFGSSPFYFLVYHSEDAGDSWIFSFKSPTGGLGATSALTQVLMSYDYPDSGVVYAGTMGDGTSGFSRSSDNGSSFNQISLIDYGDPANGYATTWLDAIGYNAASTLNMVTQVGGTLGAVWQTTDAGERWERIWSYAYPGVSPDISRVHRVAEEAVFTVDFTASSIWRSKDMGATFTKHITPKAGVLTAVSCVSVTELWTGYLDGSMWWSTDTGSTWDKPEENPMNSMVAAIAAMGPNVLISNSDGVHFSSDGGDTVARVGGPTEPPVTGMFFFATPDMGFAANNIIYAVSFGGNGVYRAEVDFDDPGDSEWVQIDDGVGAYTQGSVVNSGAALALPPSGVLYLVDGAVATTGATEDLLKGGLWRCANPTADVDSVVYPYFEKENKGLTFTVDKLGFLNFDLDPNTLAPTFFCSNAAAGVNYWEQMVMFTDTLHVGPPLVVPANGAAGVGTLFEGQYKAEVILAWEEMAGATMYEYQVAIDPGFLSVLPVPSSGLLPGQAVPVELSPNVTYYWRVRVASQDDVYPLGDLIGAPLISPWSEERSFKTVIGPTVARPDLQAPDNGEFDIPLSPTFEWSGITWAEVYEYELALDPTTTAGGYFAEPLVALVGTNALVSTAWKCDITLDYTTRYYWHVKAIGVDTETPWSDVGTFTTMGVPPEPVEPGEAIVIPPVEQITPAWIWAIVIIGAILVIAVVVLIVTTRRVP